MNIYFVADTHFHHTNIIKYCNRPFSSTEEMNGVMVDNWNSTIKKNDKVFMLGDFTLSSKTETIRIGNLLNGKKTLVKGNHDTLPLSVYYEAGFDYVSQYPIIFNKFFILSHEPQFIEEKGLYFNIYGHIHNNPTYKDYTDRSFCVSVERIDYTPISFSKITKLVKTLK